jgi:hypothetical protein
MIGLMPRPVERRRVALSIKLVKSSVMSACLAVGLSAGSALAIIPADRSPNTVAPAAMNVYDNVGRIGAGSGVYIGNGYVLTATHVTGSTIDLAGASHGISKVKTFVRKSNNYASDVSLYRLSEPASVSHLPAIALATSTPTRGSDVLMVGTGDTGNGTRAKSWATSSIASNNFDTLVSGRHVEGMKLVYNAGADNGQAAAGDSGGAVFSLVDGRYVLTGLMHALYDGNYDDDFTDFGDGTIASDLSKYAGQLAEFNINGNSQPIPEPASVVLLGLGALILRRRA